MDHLTKGYSDLDENMSVTIQVEKDEKAHKQAEKGRDESHQEAR